MIDQKVVQTWAGSYGLKPLYYGEGDSSLVILGEYPNAETHPEEKMQQEELIKLLGLAELVREASGDGTYDSSTQTFCYRDTGEIRDYSTETAPWARNPWIKLSNECGMRLTGGLTRGEYEEMSDRFFLDNPGVEFDTVSDWVRKETQKIMGRNIAESVSNSEGPVLAIVSACNAGSESEIHRVLQEKGLSYVCIDQTGRYSGQEGE